MERNFSGQEVSSLGCISLRHKMAPNAELWVSKLVKKGDR